MPALTIEAEAGKKRKRKSKDTQPNEAKVKRGSTKRAARQEHGIGSQILLLENQILESRRHYNHIPKLLKHAQNSDTAGSNDIFAAVALCRVFCRLMAAGSLNKSRETAGNESIIVKWLIERYQDFINILMKMLSNGVPEKQSTALTLLMQLVKEEASSLALGENAVWHTGTFTNILRTLIESTSLHEARLHFLEKYVKKFGDVRYYTFACLAGFASGDITNESLDNILSILTAIENPLNNHNESERLYISSLSSKKQRLHSPAANKKQAQKAWLAVLRQDLSKAQRKTLLDLMAHRIAPWFLNIERLMDFLTDSFNVGGSTSLLALSGLFYLVQEKNLDYPQFYPKLYSLLNSEILHSKHRSRFFRLLDTFLTSTHLPAALVASFIKRLSRLTLHSPPSGIVVVVPWIYNLLKSHPTCTFMIHREIPGQGEKMDLEENGMEDPFRMDEPDPMKTKAIESSLWEIEMLQTHYHPNVATIAKIISEQFTKQAYNIEDFLDHSYGSMLNAELTRDTKKAPVIEYEIPKTIFKGNEDGSERKPSLLIRLWDFS